ncbi:beta-lactamase regulator AmpE [Alteromonas pelagimontana]|uniref:Beta-lactamase regulator AmpE n=1 Tax=Alteromonas pelagimontana TaxID=1858656 RepID=A0A6M4MCZ5_9ALTE|nr:beta-lactamase regulator AmpE [Alteromonas pelagimontana]QJR80006.1 beta-lactamase regulator AmpE [Alteromonas pelagimontana]
MILISLLLALLITRNIKKSADWQITTYSLWYRHKLMSNHWISPQSSYLSWFVAVVAPACIAAVIFELLPGSFLTFVLQTLILVVCIGEPRLKATYKAFLQAANRNDIEACALYSAQLEGAPLDTAVHEQPAALGATFGRQLIWMNYQHYMAVMLWFVAFGAPGALLYALTQSFYEQRQPEHGRMNTAVRRTLWVLNFIPVRVAAFGFLVVGHFSTAFPIWLQYLTDLKVNSRKLLTNVAVAAEPLSEQSVRNCQQNIAVEPKIMVRLIKRNILFLLVVTAVLTLMGAIA